MNRREFARNCISCMGAAIVVPTLDGCQSTYYTTGTLETNGISVLKSEFTTLKGGKPFTKNYILVRNEALKFPIYLYRFSDVAYTALLMKCTHQGNELQASGDHLHCPAHGSEFNNNGALAQGPAEANLRSFEVSIEVDKIFIDLRA